MELDLAMKRLLLTLAFLFVPGIAWAQCTGIFPPNTSCGNFTASPAPPSAQAIGVGTVGAGTANQMPFYLNSGAAVTATSSLPTGFDLAGGNLSHDQFPSGSAPVWNRVGKVLDPTVTHCGVGSLAAERGMLYEGNPQILTNYTNVFKMWYHVGASNPTDAIYYAESPDGINWTCYSGNPVIGPGWTQSKSIVTSGSTYVLYPVNTTTGKVDQFTSSNGLTWVLAQSNVMSITAGWEGTQIGNPYVWQESPSSWKMLYYGNNAGTCVAFNFALGLATSTDGITWTKNAGNPVATDGCPSSAWVYKNLAGTYDIWSQITTKGQPSETISDMMRFTSTNLTSGSWMRLTDCTFCRSGTDEGFANSLGQVADPTLLQVGGRTYMYYDATPDQSKFVIKLAIANMGLEQLITTSESTFPIVPAGFGNPWKAGLGANGEQLALQYNTVWGTVGFNAYYNYDGTIAPIGGAGQIGKIERFTQAGTNVSGQWINMFVNHAGGTTFINGADMTSGGDINQQYLYGTANTQLCMNTLSPGSCGQGIQPWAGTSGFQINNGGTINTGTGGLKFARHQAPESASPGANASFAEMWDDSTSHRWKFNFNGGQDVTVPGLVSSGTIVTSGNIGPNTCLTQVIPVTGALSTDVMTWTLQGAPQTSWSSTNVLTHMTSGFANLDLCNPSTANLSPASMTVNYHVTR